MKYYIYIVLGLFVFLSCQEPFTPDFADEEPTVVIEGYIQAGEEAAPSIVSISKTYPLFQDSDVIRGPELYLGGATVSVSDGINDFQLTEICTENLDPAILEQLIDVLGFDSLIVDLGICFYADFTNQIQVEAGKQYDLKVLFEGKEFTSTTTIPEIVPIDSFNIYTQGNEDFRGLNGYFEDPVGPNFYRLKVATNGGNYRNDFSVIDDVFFDTESFEFPINNQPDGFQEDFDPETAGLFPVGDTVGIQWQIIDEAHFDFWNTLEFARGNQGPFASYTRADSNIKGGAIGIWGGSSIKYYEVIIE